jgi:hypothetical protein
MCLMLIPFQVLAEPFVSFGLGVHSMKDKPEIHLDRYVGVLETGYRKDNWILKYTHVSGLRTTEKGYGLNMITVNYIHEFK